MNRDLGIQYPLMLIHSGIPNKSEYTEILFHSAIPELSEKLRRRISCMLVLDWYEGCSVTAHNKGSSIYRLSTSLTQVIAAIGKQVQQIRDETGQYSHPIPLVLLTREKPHGFVHTSVTNYREAVFLGLRLLSGRTDTNERSAVILSKYANPRHYRQLVEGWQGTRHDVRIESKLSEILGPFEGREFPDVLSVHGKYHRLVYVNRLPEMEEEIMEREFFIPGQRRRSRKNTTGLISLTHPDDQSVIGLLWEHIKGRGTYLNIYREGYTGTKDCFHLHLDVPEMLGKCLMI